ncbi:MAG: DUF4880 domain-containing protein, partial [Caulobacterales bacterium]|nr:DUF4880 domain-containing protein [Caulobacterales bacterium]
MTNIINFPDTQSIFDEAASWAAKVDAGELSPADEQALKSWLSESAEHRAAFREMARAADALSAPFDSLSLADDADLSAAAVRRCGRPALRALAASLAAVIGAAALVLASGLLRPAAPP